MRSSATPGGSAELVEAMRYATLGGGKRMRPLLAYAAGELTQAAPDAVDGVAAAVEMIHAYSLVHDDLPCMDNDVLRRGKPTCHVKFGEAMALLAGDALQAQAFVVLQSVRLPDPAQACRLLAHAAGAPGMAGGQAIDLLHVGKPLALPELEGMHRMKTGAMIRVVAAARRAVRARRAGHRGGARRICPRDRPRLPGRRRHPRRGRIGGSARQDRRQGRRAATSRPTSRCWASRRRSGTPQALREEAHASLVPFGARARRLREIADWIVRRDH